MDENETLKGLAATVAIIGMMYLIGRCAPEMPPGHEIPYPYYKFWFRPCMNKTGDENLRIYESAMNLEDTPQLEERVEPKEE